MSKDRVMILNDMQVEQKLQRIARELIELHYNNKTLILVGISSRGLKIASKIHSILENISEIDISLFSLLINKDNPINHEVTLSTELTSLKDQTVILIDDVLNSGKTLMHAASYLLEGNLKQLSTVILVDRRHRLFPIRADFVGLTLSTTLKEHISVVEIENNSFEVYLN